jgi:hypothetical protein
MTNAADQVTSHPSEKDLQQSSVGGDQRVGSPLDAISGATHIKSLDEADSK